jgi:hypothetical protein
MTRGAPAAIASLLLCGLLSALPGPLTSAQDRPDGKHRSPRATVRTLLTAIITAQANPQLIEDAAACLDPSGLAADAPNAGLLASQLEAVLRARDVDTELIPDNPEGTVYALPDGHGQRIALHRLADGRWLFDRETVAGIPKLYAEAQKRLQDKNKEAASLSVSP